MSAAVESILKPGSAGDNAKCADGIEANVTSHHILRRASRRAIKPCGDQGDDRTGHGTHLSGLAAGGAFAPAGHEEEVIQAGEYNGMAPEAKIYFTDLMQNADPACNTPGLPCSRVSEMSVPVDVSSQLFPKPYAAGAKVHLDSWGCTVPIGESPHYCNNYTTHSMEIDKFAWEHKDFLVVTAVGDTGNHPKP